MNPLIDIGQIEGGFVMGLGCHLMEDIVCDSNAVQVLNSELSPKTYWWGLRSQEVGEEGDCT